MKCHWKYFNNCNSTAIITNVPNTNTADGCTAEYQIWENGSNGVAVEHYKIIDGEHSWPGALFPNGITNQDINAAEKIWEFFNNYDINGLIHPTNIKNITTEKSAKLIKVVDVLGRVTIPKPNSPLFYIYKDGTVKKRILIK